MTEFDKLIALKQYEDMLRAYKRKEKELQQLHIDLERQRDTAGITDPLPWEEVKQT